MKKKIILTFDLEFWYDTKFLRKWLPENPADHLIENLRPLSVLLKKYDAKATFFVTGKAAERYPDLLKELKEAGHEIASHGYSHKILDGLNKEEFAAEIEKSVGLIEDAVGQKPKGFRAPNFSLSKRTLWALPILKQYGFLYDSGNKIAESPLIELPVAFWGIRPGGVYFRFLPFWLFKFLLCFVDRPVIYLHPHELDKTTPRFKKGPWLKRKIKYCGINSSFNKLEKLLQSFDCNSIENTLKI